ncbi:MAG: NUDIX domain-containing protein [Patescibacteria group bacterium]
MNVLPIRPGAYAIVSMDDGRIVLVRKTRGPLTGKFDLPGGGIDHGESHVEAVVRELREELGLFVHTAKLFDVFHDVVIHDKPEGKFEQHLLGIVFVVGGVTSEEFDESVTE